MNHESYSGRISGPDTILWNNILTLDVSIHDGESQESLLRRFQKKVQMSGVLRELKSNRFFIPKSEAARIKAKKSAQRRRKQGY